MEKSTESYAIIHKQAGTSIDNKEKELEVVLEREYRLIVIEPRLLGDHVIRWIKAGNFLHKSSVISNLGALVIFPFVPKHILPYTVLPLGGYGIFCMIAYNVSWHRDPCCKYQVDWEGQELSRVPGGELSTRSPVILVRRNDIFRVVLHSSLSLFVVSCFCWKLYTSYY